MRSARVWPFEKRELSSVRSVSGKKKGQSERPHRDNRVIDVGELAMFIDAGGLGDLLFGDLGDRIAIKISGYQIRC